MSDETNEGKILIFSPSGFILKLIFSIAMTAVMTSFLRDGAAEKYSLFQVIFFHVMLFVIFWFAASMFGFCLRATGNYIIAVILMVILLVAFTAGMSYLSSENETMGNIVGIGFIVFLIWLPINDIRKAILYFKNTV